MYDQCNECACFCGNWDEETEELMTKQAPGEECSMGRLCWYQKDCSAFSPIAEVKKNIDPNLWKKNLGLICSGAYRISIDEHESHADVSLWGAPGECHGDVAKYADKARYEYWESIRLNWGVTFKEVKEEFERRVTTNFNMFNLSCLIFT